MHPERIRHFRGTSYEVGFAMGRALGPRLGQNIAAYLRK